MSDLIKEVFDQYGINVDGQIQLFETYVGAQEALNKHIKGAEQTARAVAYCVSRGIEGKNKVGKMNILEDFMLFESVAESVAEPTEDEPVAT